MYFERKNIGAVLLNLSKCLEYNVSDRESGVDSAELQIILFPPPYSSIPYLLLKNIIFFLISFWCSSAKFIFVNA